MKTILGALGAKCASSGRAAAGAIALAAVTLAPTAHAQAPAEALQPFKNFFVTGDYVATGVTLGGTGTGGFASGNLNVGSQIPAGAEVVAAYLYWTTVGPADAVPASLVAGAQFKRNDLAGAAVLVGRELNDASRCGGNWRFSTSRAMYVFRADVLRFFPRVRPDDPTKPVAVGVGGMHQVRLPDGGADTTKASTLGAGLVLVYRQVGFDPVTGHEQPLAPLRSIVIYEGAATLDSRKAIQTSTMRGFYEASQTPAARLSMFVAQGLPNTGETVTLQSTVDGTGVRPVATDPFVGGNARRQPGYDAVTFENAPLDPGAMQARVTLQAGPSQQLECLNWSTAVLSTNVQDTDLDGLLDVWESSAAWSQKPANLRGAYASWPLVEPNGTTLPNLEAMGAHPSVQDLFVEIDYLQGTDRSHAPSRQSLLWVADTFRRAAPRPSLVERGLCPDAAGNCPINVHFDIGGLYQPNGVTMASCRTTWSAECAFIPTGAGTRGGDVIQERQCVDPIPGDGIKVCPFPTVPGTVGWKNGFRAYRDGLVDIEDRTPCARGQAGCEPRFLRNRKDIFRYALFARALGVPSDSNPSLPRRSSGVADSGGGDLMITLGLWGDKQGLTFVEASTLTHELGHTLGLRHGGVLPDRSLGTNCRPNYQSVMNYLFQIGGVRSRTTGEPLIDFSRSVLPFYNEAGLSEAAGLGGADYLARWYAPKSASFLDQAIGTTPATRYCDGTPLPALLQGQTREEFVRIDSTPRAAARGPSLDWNGDGDLVDTPVIDANYDGRSTSSGPGVSDFATMDLRQVGARRSIGSERLSRSVVNPSTGLPIPSTSVPIGGGFSLDAQPNLVALGYGDLGYGDLGYGDLGYGDLGYGDLGYGDLGYGDLGYGDLGYGDLGYGDLGYGDLGYGDLGYGDLGVPLEAPTTGTPPLGAGEITLEAALTTVAPPVLTATVETGPFVLLSWDAPTVGRVLEYRVYRVGGADVTAANTANGELVLLARLYETAGPPRVPPPTSISDSLLLSGTYTYFVVAVLENPDDPAKPLVSGASNFATVTVTVSSTCARRLVDVVARDGFASVPFPGEDPGPLGAGLRLNAMGLLARGTQTGQVWQLRNTSSVARAVTLRPDRGGGSVSLTLQPDSELYYWTRSTARHQLVWNGVVQDAKDASPSRFAISRPVRDTACR